MASFYLLFFFIGIIVVVYWTRQNDAVPPGGETTGILRMTPAEPSRNDTSNHPNATAPAVSHRPSRDRPFPGP
jgi:hypothetical protein